MVLAQDLFPKSKEDLETEENLKEILTFLDKSGQLGHKLYYPGCGWDRTPIEVLGGKRVYHLSLNETKGMDDFNPEKYGEKYRPIYEEGYYGVLGEDAKHKYLGDVRNTQKIFKTNMFDSTLLKGISEDFIIEAISELRRVTKDGGLFIVMTEEQDKTNIPYRKLLRIFNDTLKRLYIEEKPNWAIYRNENK